MKVLIDLWLDVPEEEQEQACREFCEQELDFSGSSVSLRSIAEETEDISDGYHTFKELYSHRIELFIALCNTMDRHRDVSTPPIWKSKKHSDGSSWEGWFICGIGKDKGKQITYHLPLEKWDDLHVDVLDQAPEFDGHTPADVLERLKSI